MRLAWTEFPWKIGLQFLITLKQKVLVRRIWLVAKPFELRLSHHAQQWPDEMQSIGK